MRPIDADELKKELSKRLWFVSSPEHDAQEIMDIIDNAPPIPLPDFKDGYEQTIIDGKTNFSRPQGEWIKIDEEWYDYKCSICGEKVRKLYPFCHCGADMQKCGEKDEKRNT